MLLVVVWDLGERDVWEYLSVIGGKVVGVWGAYSFRLVWLEL